MIWGISFPVETNLSNFKDSLKLIKQLTTLKIRHLDINIQYQQSLLGLPHSQSDLLLKFLVNNPFKFSFSTHARYFYSRFNFNQYLTTALEDISLSAKFNSKNINFHPPLEICFEKKDSQSLKKISSFFKKIIIQSQKHNLTPSWENIVLLKKVGNQWKLEKQIDNHSFLFNIGLIEKTIQLPVNLTIDTGHMVLGRKSPNSILLNYVKKTKKSVTLLHLHDNDALEDKHWFPGLNKGVVKWNEVLNQFQSSNIPLILEIDTQYTSEQIKNSLNFLKNQL